MTDEGRLDLDWGCLREIRDTTLEIERLLIELQELGKEMPVVRQNVRAILSLIYVLKCGVSDVVEISEQEDRQ